EFFHTYADLSGVPTEHRVKLLFKDGWGRTRLGGRRTSLRRLYLVSGSAGTAGEKENRFRADGQSLRRHQPIASSLRPPSLQSACANACPRQNSRPSFRGCTFPP